MTMRNFRIKAKIEIRNRFIGASDWLLGRSNAHVTILEYGDFECPYCAMTRPLLEGLVDDYPDVIQLSFRHFPVTRTHKFAMLAAEAAEAAGAQGRFWEMHDILSAVAAQMHA